MRELRDKNVNAVDQSQQYLSLFKSGMLSLNKDGNVEVVENAEERNAIAEAFAESEKIDPNYDLEVTTKNIVAQRSKRKQGESSLIDQNMDHGAGGGEYSSYQGD